MKEFTYVGIDMFCTHTFTPVFHRDDFHRVLQQKNGISAACDEKGIFRALETVLLPETPVQLVCSMQDHVVQITTDAYPYSGFFFTDQRLLRESYGHSIPMPCAEEILQRLYSCVGAPYVWGGNAPCLTEMEELYPEAETHCLSGFDCSGLIYYASHGNTPRNTSAWRHFGVPLAIDGLSIEEISSSLQPLDAIVWNGHILFALSSEELIESRIGKGVVVTSTEERLQEIYASRQPSVHWQKETFCIHRWHISHDHV